MNGGANQFTTTYSYNPWNTQGGRLANLNTGNSATFLQNLSYTYDRVGNILEIDDNVAGSPQQQVFTYDDLDRLTSAQASGGSGGIYGPDSYTYDATTGNLASKAGVSYTYDAQVPNGSGTRTIAHAVSAAGSNSYSYDENGNMTGRNIGGTNYTLSYDAENRLTNVSGGATATFTYNGDGNRVKSTVGSTTTAYIGNYLE